jgi:hypothetical protein
MRFTRVFLLVALFALVAVPAALAIRFTDDSYFMPTGTVGQPYSKTFGGAGGCGPALPYQYTIIGGNLPPGLSLSFSGTIGGTPTAAGNYSFWVDLSDQNPPSESWCRPADAQREFTITVNGGAPAVPLSINQAALAPKFATVSAPYSVQLSAAGGGTQTWSVIEGSLPSGLQLSSSGLISGTPTATGDFTFKVRVSDGTRSATQTYALSVVQPLKIAPVTVPAGEVSVPFALGPTVAGGKGGYTWSAAGLPTDVSLDAATGRLSGSPSAPGSFPVKLTVTDSLGLTDTVEVTLTFAPKLSIAARALRAARVGHAFALRLAATGGIAPRTWKVVRGALPAGVHFSTRTGAFSGTPKRAGKTTLVLQVRDGLNATARVTLVLRVKA